MEKPTGPTLGTPGERSELAEIAASLERIEALLEKVLADKPLKKHQKAVTTTANRLSWTNLWLFLLVIGFLSGIFTNMKAFVMAFN